MLPLTREYALTELAAYSEFERDARKRWVEWYIHYTEEYGGKDWTEWHIQFDEIEVEWENLLAVFNWCVVHERYHELRTFWSSEITSGVKHFATIYGYWNDRLDWIRLLLQAAERRGDWPTAIQALLDVGYTLTLMGQLEEAEKSLNRAWSLREHASPRIQANLAEDIADLRIYQGQFTDALNWFDRAKAILDTELVNEPERTRRKAIYLYYYGIMCYKQKDYIHAEKCFQEMIEYAQNIGWELGTIYAENMLADLAIARGQLDKAQDLLQTGLLVAELNKDKRRIAHYKRSFAYLRQKQGNLEEAYRWAKEAFDGFERLGMQLETEEMHVLLQELQA